jgi:dissimilatory sulfite reductase (desulfoviridin) alpha/beta subunit
LIQVKDSRPDVRQEDAMRPTAPLPPFTVKVCRGAAACPRAVTGVDLSADIGNVLARSGWAGFLKSGVGAIRHHHQFRVAVSSCPNGCTQPHIADFALIAFARIGLSPEACTACGQCVEACAEDALDLTGGIGLDPAACLGCAACARVCPEGALTVAETGWRVLLGGKLGRHPRLAHELGVFDTGDAMTVLEKVLATLMDRGRPGQRLGELITDMGREQFDALVRP